MNQKPKINKSEMKVYGFHACMALFEQRPESIIRVYCDEPRVKMLSALLKWCAANKKAYHIIPSEELEKVTQSVHHEGVCILAKQAEVLTFEDLLSQLPKLPKRQCWLYLDGVGNPHNVGSIVRVCAHFGIPYILGDKSLQQLSASSYRVAKGGAEVVQLVAMPNPKRGLQQLKDAGFAIVASSNQAEKSLYTYRFPQRTLLAFGSEGEGLSQMLLRESTVTVQIPGSGQVESLNVAVAAGLCLGEFWRQQHTPTKG